jgi:hypothetical protein
MEIPFRYQIDSEPSPRVTAIAAAYHRASRHGRLIALMMICGSLK